LEGLQKVSDLPDPLGDILEEDILGQRPPRFPESLTRSRILGLVVGRGAASVAH
jgi:hypothetical protein